MCLVRKAEVGNAVAQMCRNHTIPIDHAPAIATNDEQAARSVTHAHVCSRSNKHTCNYPEALLYIVTRLGIPRIRQNRTRSAVNLLGCVQAHPTE